MIQKALSTLQMSFEFWFLCLSYLFLEFLKWGNRTRFAMRVGRCFHWQRASCHTNMPEDLSSDPSILVKDQAQLCAPAIPQLGRQRQKNPGTHGPTSPVRIKAKYTGCWPLVSTRALSNQERHESDLWLWWPWWFQKDPGAGRGRECPSHYACHMTCLSQVPS